MKKTLITILLAMIMSVGVFTSADLVSAATSITIESTSMTVENNEVKFVVNYNSLESAYIGYTYYDNEDLNLQQSNTSLEFIGCEIGTNHDVYGFSVPEEALSVIIYTVTNTNGSTYSLSGSFEYTYSSETSISAVASSFVPYVYTFTVDDNEALFTTNYDNLVSAEVEYTYYSNEILMSQLITVDIINQGIESSTSHDVYSFTVPEEALSVTVWRVIRSDNQMNSLSGSFEYVYSEETSISAVETRIKTLYITEDLITRETAYSNLGGGAYAFRMHFNLEDSAGNDIDIDYIHSLTVEYDIVHTYLDNILSGAAGSTSTDHQVLEIIATETRNATYWPYIIPETVVTNIGESFDSDYDWMVELGTFIDIDGILPFDSVTLDQTTILTISYYFDGVFYDYVEVIDDPYDSEDIIDVVPGTTIEVINMLDEVISFLDGIGDTLKWILIGLAAVLLIVVVIFFVNVVKGILWIIKTIWWVIKLPFKIFKFTIKLPGYILDGIVLLFVPRKKRKERNKNVGRFI